MTDHERDIIERAYQTAPERGYFTLIAHHKRELSGLGSDALRERLDELADILDDEVSAIAGLRHRPQRQACIQLLAGRRELVPPQPSDPQRLAEYVGLV